MKAIEKQLLLIKDITNGLMTPLNLFYPVDKSPENIEPLLIDLISCLPENFSDDEMELYKLFFGMSTGFILCNCPLDDHVLISYKKISNCIEYEEGYDSTFDIMMNTLRSTRMRKSDVPFMDYCVDQYTKFKESISPEKSRHFVNNVTYALNHFADKHDLAITENEFGKYELDGIFADAAQGLTKRYKTILEDRKNG